MPDALKAGPERFAACFEVLPHPRAPLMNEPGRAKAALGAVLSELAGPNPTLHGEMLDLLRQLALVNLFFFIKFVLGAFSNLNYLSYGLQLDLCNWLQSTSVMNPGARACLAMFRGGGKSDIATIGHSCWLLFRNANESILIVNAKKDRAVELFTSSILVHLSQNELLRLLDPELCAFPRQTSQSSFVVPNRSIYRKEPSVKAMGCTGSTEGDRGSWGKFDDLIGLDDMTSENMSAASMEFKTRFLRIFLKANMDSLSGRALGCLTTFGVDSTYSQIFKNLRKVEGYEVFQETYKPGGSRVWTLYMRDVNEYGQDTLPEVHTEASLRDLKDADPQLYYSQYRMLPEEGGLLELRMLPVGRAKLVRDNDGSYAILYPAEEKRRLAEDLKKRTGTLPPWDLDYDDLAYLGDLAHAAMLDPAGTAREEATSKSSRSALVYWTRDHLGRTTMLYEAADYFGPWELFERIRELAARFEGHIPFIGVEKAAMQKVLPELLERVRDLLWDEGFVAFRPVEAGGDKVARIRWEITPVAVKSNVWVVEGQGHRFLDEWAIFPSTGRKGIDALDASEKAFKALWLPQAPLEETEDDWELERRLVGAEGVGASPVTGY